MGPKNLENGYHGNKKKPKMVFLARKTLGAIDLKHTMYTQLDSWNNMGWVPPGSFPCVWLKCQKKVFQQKHLNLGR